ncbi:MAG TPA: polyprenyl synthetase family protein, partial [Myxococcota bacterium]|nr:polyprenyl synthetase family protein [Myxococcota bacterium]
EAATHTMSLTGASVEERLAEVEALMGRLARGAPDDVLGPLVAEHLQTGGKRLRARLALAASRALGAAWPAAVSWAAACELAHNATLVHDDLQDGDTTRRGHPTVWARHGAVQAINVGDLLFMLPYVAVGEMDAPAATRAALSRAVGEGLAVVIRGQALECSITARGITDRPIYDATIRGKTSALFTLPVTGAAILAGHGDPAAVAAPFSALGALFQMQDDVLDLYGNKGREASGSDVREGKISALVVEHLAHHPNDRPWLLSVLQTPREATPDAEVAKVIERLHAGGTVDRVLEAINRESEIARAGAAQSGVPGLSRLMQELVELVLAPIAHLWAQRRGP